VLQSHQCDLLSKDTICVRGCNLHNNLHFLSFQEKSDKKRMDLCRLTKAKFCVLQINSCKSSILFNFDTFFTCLWLFVSFLWIKTLFWGGGGVHFTASFSGQWYHVLCPCKRIYVKSTFHISMYRSRRICLFCFFFDLDPSNPGD